MQLASFDFTTNFVIFIWHGYCKLGVNILLFSSLHDWGVAREDERQVVEPRIQKLIEHIYMTYHFYTNTRGPGQLCLSQ